MPIKINKNKQLLSLTTATFNFNLTNIINKVKVLKMESTTLANVNINKKVANQVKWFPSEGNVVKLNFYGSSKGKPVRVGTTSFPPKKNGSCKALWRNLIEYIPSSIQNPSNIYRGRGPMIYLPKQG